MNVNNFYVRRDNLKETHFDTQPIAELEEGQVLLKVDRFAFTANNITYAALGDIMRYWAFFPAQEGLGSIPVWGFADVVASKCTKIAEGERFYGYYPMSSHLVVEPKNIVAGRFIDGAEHRQPLAIIYNNYLGCAQDPLYTAETEALQMLLRPLFSTAFLLDDFFSDNNFFDAETLVLTSASSKTALGMAFLLKQKRQDRQQAYKIIGLTSSENLEFVKSLDCYDQVLSYDEINIIANNKATAIVDFAGNGELRRKLHTHLNKKLKYSCSVGMSHWDQQHSSTNDLAGPAPQMFFAPSQGEKRIKEWGSKAFQQRLAKDWSLFSEFANGWIEVEYNSGKEAIEHFYQNGLAGKLNPKQGHIMSL